MSFLDSKRIIGTNTERTGADAILGGWKELGRTTLGSATSTMSVSSLPDKRYYQVLLDMTQTIDSNYKLRLNNDTGSNYAFRFSNAGGSDNTSTSQTSIDLRSRTANEPTFWNGYIANLDSKEKLSTFLGTMQSSAGAGTTPSRTEQVGKWANTSDSINQIGITSGSGNLASGSQVVVLGYDSDDTHTTNFWEQLASVDAGGSSNTLSASITSKKYLWIQGYTENTSGSVVPRVGYSSLDSGSNYATRLSSNGGSQDVSTGATEITGLTSTTPIFWNMFIKNISGDEKLIIWNVARQNTAGVGNAPNRVEGKSKWVNTSNQIDTIGFVSTTGGSTINSNSSMTVWGSN